MKTMLDQMLYEPAISIDDPLTTGNACQCGCVACQKRETWANAGLSMHEIEDNEDERWQEMETADLGFSGLAKGGKTILDIITGGLGQVAGAILNPFKMSPEAIEKITEVAANSEIARYHWRQRGIAPSGYIKGMAVVYATVYRKLLAGDPVAVEMAKANTGDSKRDALAHYAQEFKDAGMSNESSGVDTLRHLFVLLIGLGMRESSGKWCVGRDKSADNKGSETAEAGLFQTSYNLRTANILLPKLFQYYVANPSGFLNIFKEGVRCGHSDLENHGTGDGNKFQQLTKNCPAFAAEFAAIGLRNRRRLWGPIIRKAAEIRVECDKMLLQVQKIAGGSVVSPSKTKVPAGKTDWAKITRNDRIRYVMNLLVQQYGYPLNGAAGLVGNLLSESELLPNRIEGSNPNSPMRAPNFNNILADFTAEEVMKRSPANRKGPRLAGIGLAQWTAPSRRGSLFAHRFQGIQWGSNILNSMDAQVDFLVNELHQQFHDVDRLLRQSTVKLENASDEVVYNFEKPGSIIANNKKLPRTHPNVIAVFRRRRISSQQALKIFTQ